jgi:hypothetical protein
VADVPAAAVGEVPGGDPRVLVADAARVRCLEPVPSATITKSSGSGDTVIVKNRRYGALRCQTTTVNTGTPPPSAIRAEGAAGGSGTLAVTKENDPGDSTSSDGASDNPGHGLTVVAELMGIWVGPPHPTQILPGLQQPGQTVYWADGVVVLTFASKWEYSVSMVGRKMAIKTTATARMIAHTLSGRGSHHPRTGTPRVVVAIAVLRR